MTTLPAELERVLSQAASCGDASLASTIRGNWLWKNLDAIRSALADQGRLDWLGDNSGAARHRFGANRNIAVWDENYPRAGHGRINNIRNAIDSARAQEAGK